SRYLSGVFHPNHVWPQLTSSPAKKIAANPMIPMTPTAAKAPARRWGASRKSRQADESTNTPPRHAAINVIRSTTCVSRISSFSTYSRYTVGETQYVTDSAMTSATGSIHAIACTNRDDDPSIAFG